jgi:methylase of polypeptide subunit release factors
VVAVASNLFSAIAPGPQFDVILTNPPFCNGRAWATAERAWRAGLHYKDIVPLFDQARERLEFPSYRAISPRHGPAPRLLAAKQDTDGRHFGWP